MRAIRGVNWVASLLLAGAWACQPALPAPATSAHKPVDVDSAAPSASSLAPGAAAPQEDPKRAASWGALAQLPDWDGSWNPNITDQNAQIKSNPVPWNVNAALEVARLGELEKAGHPKGLFVNCLPEGMPAWMLITHNALEFLCSPGRVTILGESDGNRIRRIYTDGRAHPQDPDLSFHGHSIGHWENDTLVVDTVAVLPQTFLAVSEAVGLPNDGDLHVVERFHLVEPDILADDLEIEAPHLLSRPWKTQRRYFRQRSHKFDVVEGVCQQGFFSPQVDADGHHVFVPVPQTEDGNPVPSATPGRAQPAPANPTAKRAQK